VNGECSSEFVVDGIPKELFISEGRISQIAFGWHILYVDSNWTSVGDECHCEDVVEMFEAAG
jgi:hypothetical protein